MPVSGEFTFADGNNQVTSSRRAGGGTRTLAFDDALHGHAHDGDDRSLQQPARSQCGLGVQHRQEDRDRLHPHLRAASPMVASSVGAETTTVSSGYDDPAAPAGDGVGPNMSTLASVNLGRGPHRSRARGRRRPYLRDSRQRRRQVLGPQCRRGVGTGQHGESRRQRAARWPR